MENDIPTFKMVHNEIDAASVSGYACKLKQFEIDGERYTGI
jgi:hypothetical protein